MTARSIYSFVLFYIFISANYSHANALNVPHVSVQGFAKDSVKPDQLTWRLSIKNEARESQAVAIAHNNSVANVLAILKKHGIEKKNIQTTHMQLSENKSYRNNQWIKEGYFASSQINFKLEDLDKYKMLWNALALFPEVSMNGFSYAHSKMDDLKADLREKALINARDKARLMAKALDMSIGKPIVIEEVGASPVPFRAERMMSAAPQMKSDDNISPGTIDYSMSVNVVFSLQE
ncbi:SIMPL domain-containing protein [Aliikangiella sp. G2MR2-5]|uniref:SIMPL domain-containing protein n=1 Tax=Aliikangiella sp. G2MR2-5 TaxID=2788943 RepID=UPI0018A9128B|nr:SIMPL domain-containing protein [Aliikangiella sp. G2MR2-5]